jgi:hypothetical protein
MYILSVEQTVYMHAYLYTRLYRYLCTHMCVCVCVCVRVYTYINTYTCVSCQKLAVLAVAEPLRRVAAVFVCLPHTAELIRL